MLPLHNKDKMDNKKDIGNLNNKDFGVQLDPTNNLKLVEDDKKGQQAYYKGSKMSYTDYVCEVGNRISKGKKGKGTDNMGVFSGVSFDENGNIIKGSN